MKKGLKLAVSVLSIFAMASCGGTSNDGKTVNVGMITLHNEQSTYDKNFIEAMNKACEEEGAKLSLKTGIDESNKCYDAAAELADDKNDIVFADSFGHEQYMIQAAEEFKDVQFAHATGTQSKQKNYSNYHNAFASIYEGRYLAGVAAGLKLQAMKNAGTLKNTNYDASGNVIIGYVGAYTYAEVISGYTSFYLGVKSVIENVVMNVTFTGSWYDETAEKNGANSLIQKGAALISQHADSMGAPTACETAGVPNVSYNGSTAASCPNTFIVSSRINWTPYFKYLIEGVKNNTKVDTDWCGSLSTGSVELTDYGTAAAAGTADKVNAVKAQLEAGTLHVFDTSKFTVTKTETKNTNATVDANGHLTAYLADIDGDYTGDTNVVADGYFHESEVANYRSAPYFDVQIDGINLLDTKF